MIIGCHVSFNKKEQLLGSVKEALAYGANAFMFYTGAPQNTVRSDIDDDITACAFKLMAEGGINSDNVIVHAPYIVNFANEKNYDFSVSFLKNEIKRVERLGFDKIVLHPGSHVGAGISSGIDNIVRCLNDVLIDTNVKILLETMAGKGSEIGSSFLEIRRIIDCVNDSSNIGVCLDTCHINDAGYDISKFDDVLSEFDKIIGLDRLLCIHINDSKNVLGSRKDRHENIGFGTIGFDNLLYVINHPKLKDVPMILETPYVKDGNRSYPPYKFEIQSIKSGVFNSQIYDDIVHFYR